jgi:hypothetical protein
MDAADIDRLDWIPEERKAELKQLIAEWTGPGRSYILVIVPPTPKSEGLTYFQPCLAAEPQENPE